MLFSVIFQDSTRSFTKGIVLKCTKYENPVFPKIVFESLRAFLHAPLQMYHCYEFFIVFPSWKISSKSQLELIDILRQL